MRLVVGLSVVALLCGGAVRGERCDDVDVDDLLRTCLKGRVFAEVGVKAPTCTNDRRNVDRRGAAGPRGKTGAQGPAGAAAAPPVRRLRPARPGGPAPRVELAPPAPALAMGGRPRIATRSPSKPAHSRSLASPIPRRMLSAATCRVVATSSPADYVEGNITALSIDYNITVDVDAVEDSGSFAGLDLRGGGGRGARRGPASASGEDSSATPSAGIDLAGCDFSDQSMSTVNFTDADLAGADFVGPSQIRVSEVHGAHALIREVTARQIDPRTASPSSPLRWRRRTRRPRPPPPRRSTQ